VRILNELQGHFFAKNAEVLDLRKIKELACAADVQISESRVAWLCYVVKYFIIPLSLLASLSVLVTGNAGFGEQELTQSPQRRKHRGH
jgi:hypothetical protein